jgi:hypothetical protein
MPKTQKWAVSAYGKVFVALCLIETLAVIFGLGYIYYELDDARNQSAATVTMMGTMITASMFYFAVDAILMESPFQLYSSLFVHIMLTIAVSFFYGNYTKNAPGKHSEDGHVGRYKDTIQLAALVEFWGIVCFQVLYLVLVPCVHAHFGWLVYKVIGGDIAMQKRYKKVQLFLSLLKLDLILTCGMFLYSSLFFDSYLLPVCGFGVSILWFVLGYQAVVYEQARLLWVFLFFSLLAPAFVSYNVIYIADLHYSPEHAASPYETATILIVMLIFLLFRLTLLIVCLLCRLNFGQGLKERAFLTPPGSPAHVQSNQQRASFAMPPEEHTGLRSYADPLLA